MFPRFASFATVPTTIEHALLPPTPHRATPHPHGQTPHTRTETYTPVCTYCMHVLYTHRRIRGARKRAARHGEVNGPGCRYACMQMSVEVTRRRLGGGWRCCMRGGPERAGGFASPELSFRFLCMHGAVGLGQVSGGSRESLVFLVGEVTWRRDGRCFPLWRVEGGGLRERWCQRESRRLRERRRKRPKRRPPACP